MCNDCSLENYVAVPASTLHPACGRVATSDIVVTDTLYAHPLIPHSTPNSSPSTCTFISSPHHLFLFHHHPISFVYMASFRHYLASAWHRKQDLPYIHISSIFPSIHIPAPRSPYLTALASSVSALASYYDIHPHSIPHMHRRRSSILCIPDPFIPVYHRIDIILASP